LKQDVEDLVRRTDLEEETILDVMNIEERIWQLVNNLQRNMRLQLILTR
jgi:hypothetical protein